MNNSGNQENKMPFVCPKTGRVIGGKKEVKKWKKWLLPFIGVVSLIWFIIRVIPKPSRANYPCQRAAAPMAASFIAWVVGLAGPALILKKAGKKMYQARYITAAVLVITGVIVTSVWTFNLLPVRGSAYTLTDGPNQPVGTGKGVYPGRVTWVHDPNAASFNGSGNWWSDTANNQAEYDKMITAAVRNLSGQSTEAAAWDALFKNFNQRRGKGSIGYQAGEKIAVKINQNNTGSQANTNDINANPSTILALVKSLVNAGVDPSAITVGDPSRYVTDNIFSKCKTAFPTMNLVDNIGTNGRIKSTYSSNAIPFSVDNGALAKGICTMFTDASYVINLALLKGHTGQGITFCGKNFYGTTSISPNYWNNAHNNFSQNFNGTPKYMTFTDFMGHKDLGEKVVLWMIDAMYPTQAVNGTPSTKWNMEPFNGGWPSSMFVSQDGVAVDSVGIDFFRTQWPNTADLDNCDAYLHEAAQADNPPSKTFYDPEKDGIRCKSLGVHEHWNNAADKKYSRNLGTGNGIELVYIRPDQTQPSATPPPANTPTPTKTVTPSSIATATPDDTVQFKVDTAFSLTSLTPNQMITARVTAANISGTPYTGNVDVLMIVALYDANNTMVNISYISKGIPYRGTETLSAGFKLPSNVNGLKVKAFMWDGNDIKTTNMIPISNVKELP